MSTATARTTHTDIGPRTAERRVSGSVTDTSTGKVHV